MTTRSGSFFSSASKTGKLSILTPFGTFTIAGQPMIEVVDQLRLIEWDHLLGAPHEDVADQGPAVLLQLSASAEQARVGGQSNIRRNERSQGFSSKSSRQSTGTRL